MRKLITRGLPVALALGAVLCGPAAAAYADTPADGPGKSLGHANTPNGKAKGQPAPAPTPDPTPTPTPTPTTYLRSMTAQGSSVTAMCDPGDTAVENAAVMIVSQGFHVENGPIPQWDAAGTIYGYGMTFRADPGVYATGTGTITITCSDVSA